MIYDKLVSIQYPSGSFGHFTHFVLSNFGKNYVTSSEQVSFESQLGCGNSHFTTSKIEKYYVYDDYKEYASTQLPLDYQKITANNKFTTAIIDSGITDDSTAFLDFMPGCKYIRICYDDISWPLSANAFYARVWSEVIGKITTATGEITGDMTGWEGTELWEQREKYFLFLRDHHFRKSWQANSMSDLNLNVMTFLSYDALHSELSKITELENFESLYDEFRRSNAAHINWYLTCLDVRNAILQKSRISLAHLRDDLLCQATINYFIQVDYNFEIPAYDYRDWFASTDEIFEMFDKHDVRVNLALLDS
jgi:hypothetical protein